MTLEHSPDVPAAGAARPKRPYRRGKLPLMLDPGRTIIATLPRCRACNSTDLKTIRTECRDEDGVIRRMQCRCGQVWCVSFE